MKYSITYPDMLRELCIRENWFTCGNTRQYQKLFEMNDEKCPLADIAVVIWICSNDVPRSEIVKKLNQVRTEYMAAQDIFNRNEEG